MADQASTVEPVSNQAKDENPISEDDYQLPEMFEKILNHKVADMQKRGIIRESTSDWNSTVQFVLRKVNTSRPVHCSDVVRIIIDYRPVNERTVPKPASNPLTMKRLFPLVQGRCYSILDCRLPLPCHQIPISEESRPKTAFTAPIGRWEFNFLPYGMCDSSRTFRMLISKMLFDLQGEGAVGYGDYIIISSSDVESNMALLRKVKEKLEKFGLKLNAPGCVFLHQEIKILGG